MGVTISAKNSKYSFDMGYGGFSNLRTNIALVFDKELGEHYATLRYCYKEEDYEAFDKKANEILKDPRFTNEDNDILDFLFGSDENGKINYRTCGKIYNIIKDHDFGGKIFIYAAYSDGKDYEHLKEFLKECYSHRRNMCWS